MNQAEHFKKLNDYFTKSRLGYDLFLEGAKHFGYYPKNKKISEKEAQILMQDLIGEKLNLKKSMKVLDAGCGQGVVSTYLAKKFDCHIDGITMVNFEIGIANKLAERMNVSNNINYSLMDYSNTEFDNETFDAIYTIETLCHSTNIRKTLKEFYRVLKKGGKVALFEYRFADDYQFSNYEMELVNIIINATASPSLRELRYNKFKKIVEEAGFKNVKEQNITENFEPSLKRLKVFAYVPYLFVKIFELQKYFPNATIAVEIHRAVEKGLVKYFILTAEK